MCKTECLEGEGLRKVRFCVTFLLAHSFCRDMKRLLLLMMSGGNQISVILKQHFLLLYFREALPSKT